MTNILKSLFSKESKAKDPVCGMTVDRERAAYSSSYKGQMYYFCSESCKKQFDGDPETFT